MLEEPPPNARSITQRQTVRPRVWDEHLAGAIAAPGQWHKVVGDFDRAHMLRLARAVADRERGLPSPRQVPRLPPGRWEFRFATVNNSQRVELWARLVPDTDTERPS